MAREGSRVPTQSPFVSVILNLSKFLNYELWPSRPTVSKLKLLLFSGFTVVPFNESVFVPVGLSSIC